MLCRPLLVSINTTLAMSAMWMPSFMPKVSSMKGMTLWHVPNPYED